MPKFTLRVSQKIYYVVEVEAKTRNSAIEKLEEMIAEGEDLGEVEVDTSDFEVEERRN